MATKLKLTLILAVIGLISGAFWVISGNAQAQPVEFQATNMFAFKNANGEMLGPPFTEVDGTATLTRTKEGIWYEIYTTGLEPGATPSGRSSSTGPKPARALAMALT